MKILTTLCALAMFSVIYSQNNFTLNGNLGVGTAPENKLDVNGDSKMDGKLTVTNTTELKGDVMIDGDFKLVNIQETPLNNRYFTVVNSDGSFSKVLITEVASAIYKEDCKGITGEAFWVSDPGFTHIGLGCPTNVGIGVSQPAYSLDVNGNSRISQNLHLGNGIVNNNFRLGLDISNGNQGGLLMNHNNANQYTYTLDFRNNDASYFNIRANGSISSKLNESWVDHAFQILSHDDTSLFEVTSTGAVYARRVKVTMGEFPDYVFEKDYKLMSLVELEKFIIKNKHLPHMPSSNDVAKNGGDLGEINRVLVQKVEEQTLYIIDMNKRIEELEAIILQIQSK